MTSPALAGKAFRYDDYVALTRDAGVAGTIFMETSPDDPHWRDEAKFVYSLAAQPGSLIKGVIANCRPEEEGFEQYVDSVRHDKLVGFRRILHVVPDDVSRHPRFGLQNVRWLGTQKLTFDMCFLGVNCRSPWSLGASARPHSHPRPLRRPRHRRRACSIRGGSTRDLAKCPNVACKISGVLAYCKPGMREPRIGAPIRRSLH